uniref:Vanin C-terminal domain-containing protein n=1 Tax=Poecilia latipinna TaxID=48699 RepID=A0A3B3VVD8_9TELE
MNALPLLDSIQFHRAFSLGANVTVLSSNLRYDKLRMTGSGIYTPFSATFHHAVKGDPEEGRLLVATVPVLGPVGVNNVTESLSPVAAESDHCHTDGCADSPSPGSSYPTFKATMRRDLYWFVLINETQGNLTVCHGTFCCHLQYKWTAHDKSKELYALGAFAGTHNSSQCYALQVCAVVRCAGLEAKSCGQKVEEAESKMDFRLEATFQTDYVYPSMLYKNIYIFLSYRRRFLTRFADVLYAANLIHCQLYLLDNLFLMAIQLMCSCGSRAVIVFCVTLRYYPAGAPVDYTDSYTHCVSEGLEDLFTYNNISDLSLSFSSFSV